jgi:hypothetical protein
MNESEIKPQTQMEPDLADLQDQFEYLRSTVISILLLLVVVSGTLTIYLLRQVRYAKSDLNAFRPQATQIISDYARLTRPRMDVVLKAVEDYGRTHSDYVPILTKYGLKPAAAAPAPAAPPPAVPAPK